MRVLIASMMIAAAAAPLAAQQAPSHMVPALPQVTVSGEGQARATPDRAMITVGVQSRAATASAAAAENARKQTAVLDTLRKLGFTSEQITTANYSVFPEMQYDQQGQRPRVMGYVVSNTVRVDVQQLERSGLVIDAALARGANEIHGLNFYMSDPGPSRRAAIADAVAKARADAEALASAAGGRLGQILELSTSPSGPIMFQPRMSMDARVAGAESASTPISAGEEVVRATVSVRWAFVAN
ncbi:MAG: SIMPL domain-containing protein [Gemmatimonadaceae bacterium]|nr:SIMPL domain-containing protein [Gemmatimonadaceae bacterium]